MRFQWIFPLFQKLRSLRPQQFAAAMLPRPIDQLLYSMDAKSSTQSEPGSGAYVVERYDNTHKSHIQDIDQRLSPGNICYLIRIDEAIAHQCWLSFGALLPSQFGFDSRTPLIADGYTDPRYRGRGMLTTSMRHIAMDVASRGLSDSIFALVSPKNTPSIHSLERVGFTLRCRLRGRRILGFVTQRRIE